MNSINPTVPTPIVDRNGKPTTVHRKAADATASVSRVAALGGTKPAEKRTALKRPTNGYFPNVKDTDVIEVGAKGEGDYQSLYLNGTPIGFISSSEEVQHQKIAGSRLIRYGSTRKVWRASVQTPKVGGDFGKGVSDSDFSRSGAAYRVADSFLAYSDSAKKYQNYIDNGGIYLAYNEFGNGLAIGDSMIELPERTTLRLRKEPGHLTTSLIIRDDSRSWVKAEMEFNESYSSYGVSVSFGDDNFSYAFGSDGSLQGEDSGATPTEAQQGFIDKTEKLVKDIFAAHSSAE